MNWTALISEDQLQEIITESEKAPVMIFKHSTRCSISSMSLNRLERSWSEAEMPGIKTFYLDLLAYRPISSRIEHLFNIEHASPQAILIHHGKPVWDASHYDIQYDAVRKAVQST